MTKTAASRMGLRLAGVAALLAAAVAVFAMRGADPEPAAVTTAPAPEAPEVKTAQPAAPAPADPSPDASMPPRIDEVRMQAGGIFVIAGRAAPGSTVAVFLDGAQNTEATAGRDGSFAAVSIADPSAEPRVLSIVQRGAAGGEVAGAEEIILVPQSAAAPPPVVTAPQTPGGDAPARDMAAIDAAPQGVDLGGARPAPPAAAPAPPPPQTSAAAPPAQIAEAPRTNDAPDPAPQAVQSGAPDPAAPRTPAQSAEAQTQPPAPDAPAQAGVAAAPPVSTDKVAILRSTADGVSLANPGPPPEAMKAIALDTISYSETGDVQLSGRAQPDTAVVRVYLDNRAIAELPVDAQGRWRGDLPGIDTGVYTLRLDEVKASGAVVSRVETPFKREAPAVLEAATDSAAAAQVVTVQSGATLWAIARARYGEGLLYVRVFEANRDSIRDPDLIYPGQVFALPD